jgi:hypothetical protein
MEWGYGSTLICLIDEMIGKCILCALSGWMAMILVKGFKNSHSELWVTPRENLEEIYEIKNSIYLFEIEGLKGYRLTRQTYHRHRHLNRS